jgi:hypothetical protein
VKKIKFNIASIKKYKKYKKYKKIGIIKAEIKDKKCLA